MTWDYKPPKNFDPAISSVLIKTLKQTDNTLHIYFRSESETRSFAEKFRHFRWCVRQQPDRAGDDHKLEMQYDYRTKVIHSPHSGWHLRITAVENRLGYMMELNPWLIALAS